MRDRVVPGRRIAGVGLAIAVGITAWVGSRAAAREPVITAAKEANVPLVIFERSFPAVRFAPELAWTGDSSLLISSAPARVGFRVQTVTGEVLEEHPVSHPGIYHEILSTHEIITQGDMRAGVAFEVVDVRDGGVLFRVRGVDPAPDGSVTLPGLIQFAPRADRAVVAVGYGSPVTFYDTTTWRTLATVTLPPPGPAKIWSLRLSDDGKRLAYNSDGAVTVVDLTSGAVVQRLPISLAWKFAFSPDGQMLAAAERDQVVESNGYKHLVGRALHVFRLSDGAEMAHWQSAATVIDLEWDPRGRFLAYNDGQAVHLWNPQADSGRDVVIRFRSDIVGRLALSPDGRRMAVGDGYAIDLFRIGL